MLALLSPGLLPGVAAAVIFYAVGLAIYRRLFHPLARIPGPLLPAITTLYQSYHNCHYYQKIAELHKIYGKQSSGGPHLWRFQPAFRSVHYR